MSARASVLKTAVFERASQSIAIVSIVIALAVLSGWALHVAWLTGAIADSAAMKANTAICIALIGAAIWVLSRGSPTLQARRIIYVTAALTLLICVATAVEYVFGLNLGLDQSIFGDSAGGATPGRMGPNTVAALTALALGLAFVARDDNAKATIGQLFAATSATIAFFAMLGYFYGTTGFYRIHLGTAMAALTAVVIFALSGALLWASQNRGFMRVVHRENAAGFLVRRLLPPVVILPVVLGWLRLKGQELGLYNTATGVGLLVTANVVTLGVLVAFNARLLQRSETLRERSQEQLRETVADIERQIAMRTAELHDATARLAASERRFALAVDGAENGIIDLDLVNKRLFCSPRWKTMLGFEDAAHFDSPRALLNIVHPEDREPAMSLMFAHFKGATPSFSTEVRMKHRDGTYRWMLSRGQAVRDSAGRAIRMVGSQTDISELKALQERLRAESIHDSLTGIYNRRHFEQRLVSAVHGALRHQRPLCVCICDLDGLKGVNDTYGHQIGDQVLRAFAGILRSDTRSEDIVARYGGDEFCILFPELHAAQAAACIERIRSRLAGTAHASAQNGSFSVTASFGLADVDGMYANDFMAMADRALYDAKALGRNRLSLRRF